jgi:hypothetical protein
VESRRFVLDTLSNALGTILAVAVIYLVGVLAGVITYDRAATILSAAAAGVATVATVRLGHKLQQEVREYTEARLMGERERRSPKRHEDDDSND